MRRDHLIEFAPHWSELSTDLPEDLVGIVEPTIPQQQISSQHLAIRDVLTIWCGHRKNPQGSLRPNTVALSDENPRDLIQSDVKLADVRGTFW